MITVGMNYEVLPGKERIFEESFSRVLIALEEMEGHSSSSLYRDVFRANVYLIISDWNTKEAFLQFIRSPAFQSVTEWGREEVLASRPRHHIYDRDNGSLPVEESPSPEPYPSSMDHESQGET